MQNYPVEFLQKHRTFNSQKYCVRSHRIEEEHEKSYVNSFRNISRLKSVFQMIT